MKTSRLLGFAAALVLAVMTGCTADEAQTDATADGDGGAVRTIQIVAHDFRFEPNSIQAAPGERLQVTLVNRGEAPHNIELHLDGDEAELDSPVQPGEQASLMVQVPDEAGEYRFYCPVGNHEERGMVGNLIVQP